MSNSSPYGGNGVKLGPKDGISRKKFELRCFNCDNQSSAWTSSDYLWNSYWMDELDENFEMSPFIEKSPMVWKDFQKLTKQVIGQQLRIDYYNPNRRRQLKFKKRRNSILLWLIPMLSTIVYILIPKWTSIVYLVAIGQRLDQKMKFLKWNLNWIALTVTISRVQELQVIIFMRFMLNIQIRWYFLSGCNYWKVYSNFRLDLKNTVEFWKRRFQSYWGKTNIVEHGQISNTHKNKSCHLVVKRQCKIERWNFYENFSGKILHLWQFVECKSSKWLFFMRYWSDNFG